jgi:uncharacterized protein (TIGR03067 family)
LVASYCGTKVLYHNHGNRNVTKVSAGDLWPEDLFDFVNGRGTEQLTDHGNSNIILAARVPATMARPTGCDKAGNPSMKVLSIICTSVTIAIMGLSTRVLCQQNGKDGRMEGTWSCVAATIDGKALPEATVKHLRLTLTKDRYRTEKGTEVLFDSTYVLAASHSPPHIDIVGTEGDLKGKAAQGIYSLIDDTLKICYTMPGGPRPTTFESVPGSGAHFIVWKRQRQ